MSNIELQAWLDRWDFKAADGAKVLFVTKSRMSEWLSGARDIPNYIAAHIETFDMLSDMNAARLIKKRLE